MCSHMRYQPAPERLKIDHSPVRATSNPGRSRLWIRQYPLDPFNSHHFTHSSRSNHDRTEYHNPLGILMTRAEIARKAWLDT